MAFDPDCSDEKPADRVQLAEMAVAVTTQVWTPAECSCPADSLTLFKQRYTHWDATTGDPRLSSLGSFDIITEASSDVLGDLFVEYDFTFGAPQPAEVPASIVFGPGVADNLDAAGMFDGVTQGEILDPKNQEGVSVGYTSSGGRHRYQVGFDRPGLYEMSVSESAVPTAPLGNPSGAVPIVELSDGVSPQDVEIYEGDIGTMGGWLNSWVEGTTTVMRASYSVLINVKKINNSLRWVVDLYDIFRAACVAAKPVIPTAATLAGTGLTIAYLGGPRQILPALACYERHTQRAVTDLKKLEVATMVATVNEKSDTCVNTTTTTTAQGTNQLPIVSTRSLPGATPPFLTEEERKHFGIPPRR